MAAEDVISADTALRIHPHPHEVGGRSDVVTVPLAFHHGGPSGEDIEGEQVQVARAGAVAELAGDLAVHGGTVDAVVGIRGGWAELVTDGGDGFDLTAEGIGSVQARHAIDDAVAVIEEGSTALLDHGE